MVALRCALLALAVAGPLLAQEAAPPPTPTSTPAGDDLGDLPDSLFTATVTASRRQEIQFESPRSTSLVSRADLDRRQSRTTPEALLEEPGVWVQRTNYGGGNAFVRGLYGNRVLLLVDGIRLNNGTYRAGPNQYLNTVDPLLVDHIEVLRGTGSALHGSDAIGAAINVLTQQPSPGDDRPFSAATRLSGSTADASGQAGAKLGWSGARSGALLHVNARRFGDLRGGADTGAQYFTGYGEWSAAASYATLLGEGSKLSFSLQVTRQSDVPRTDRSTPLDQRVFTLQQRTLSWARYSAEAAGPFKDVAVTASFNLQREMGDRYRIARDGLEHDDNRVGTVGLQAQGELQAAGTLVLGAELYDDFIKSTAGRGKLSEGGGFGDTPQLARYGRDVGYLSAALFAGHEHRASPAVSLHTEARVGVVRIDLPEDDRLQRLFTSANLPRLAAETNLVPVLAGGVALRVQPVAPLALHGSASLGFRAPNIDDQSRLGVEGSAYILPTRGLSPERALTGELGAKLALPAGAQASLAYSYTYILDAIGKEGAAIAGNTVLDGQRVVRLANADSAKYAAWEATVRAPLHRRLVLSANASWAFGRTTRQVPAAAGGTATTLVEPAEKVPPLFGKVALGWFAPADAWFAEGVFRWALRQDRLAETDLADPRICPQGPLGVCTGTPGWATVSLRGGVKLGAFRAVLQAENLADLSYRMHASGVDAAGRSLAAFLEGSL